MAMPVYRSGMIPATLRERRAQFLGLVGSSFRMDDLIHGILGVHSNASEIDIEIYDGETISEKTLMHNSDGILQGANQAGSKLKTIKQLHIAGRVWTLVAHSLPGFEARLDQTKSLLLPVQGWAWALCWRCWPGY